MAHYGDKVLEACNQTRQNLKGSKIKIRKKEKSELVKFSNYDKLIRQKLVDFEEINNDGRGVSLLDLATFESRNPSIGVTVYSVKNGRKLQIIRNCSHHRPKHVNLLYLENASRMGHYILIKSLKTFLNEKHNTCFCNYCGKAFLNSKTLSKHKCLLANCPQKHAFREQFYCFNRPEFTLRQSHLIYFTLHKIRVNASNRIGYKVTSRVVAVGYTIIMLTPDGISELSQYFGPY